MTGTELKALSEIERYWHRHGSFPKRILTEGFNLDESLQKETFLRGLFNRGITPPARPVDDLSEQQMAAILMVVDINDKRTVPAKLKSMGINTQTWQGWLKDPFFKKYLHSLSTQQFEDALHVAQEGLLRSVEKGDVNAIKYWNQLTGREQPPEVMQARKIVSYLIQVIQMHVKDEYILTQIAKDFERIMRGDQPSQEIQGMGF